MSNELKELVDQRRDNNRKSGWSDIDKMMDDAAEALGYIAEEIADVRIMLDQMVILHDCAEDVNVWRKVKLGRLEKRLSAQEGDKENG